jgi:hypothetical protein
MTKRPKKRGRLISRRHLQGTLINSAADTVLMLAQRLTDDRVHGKKLLFTVEQKELAAASIELVQAAQRLRQVALMLHSDEQMTPLGRSNYNSRHPWNKL